MNVGKEKRKPLPTLRVQRPHPQASRQGQLFGDCKAEFLEKDM
jgi:hypothetical protein